MDMEKKVLRISAAAIGFALLLRLFSGGLFGWAVQGLSAPETASWLLFFGTGRLVRTFPLQAPQVALPPETQPPAPAAPAVFTQEDAALVEVVNYCGYSLDIGQMLTQPLSWDLTGPEPTVLILQTHATESYTKSTGERYTETSAFRTLDENYNMISVGDHLTQLLEAAGVGVLHDRTLHDYPSYSGSYNHARKSIAAYLEENPSIRLVLDLHRDASGDNDNQMRTRAEVDGRPSAQIMLVVGTSGSGLKHPDWERNLALGLKLHTQLERTAPGITRYVNLRAQRFNQDMSPGCLIVEIGAAGNTHAEALVATEVLAQAILSLSKGSSVS